MSDDTTHNIQESADKIVLKTKVVRGEGTRDQDKLDVKIKGNDPEETAERLKDTLEWLEAHHVTETLRSTQPEGNDD